MRAAWMAGEALSRTGEYISSMSLIPSDHGKFHIDIDDELVAAHEHLPDVHKFPDLQDLMKAILDRA